ncbi:hypothetical protein GALL_41840 [mine drainage metagenome]|uniref:Uncharacterized protein n=1 Tax=mine drainage metagenome TaxID=410659 RepID=A0A1J5T2G2_9ZZZZ
MALRSSVVMAVTMLAGGIIVLLIFNAADRKTWYDKWEPVSALSPRPGISPRPETRVSAAVPHLALQQATFPDPPSKGEDQRLCILADRWAGDDPVGSATWVAKQPDGPEKTRILSAMSAVWARKNPREAAALIANLGLPDGEAKDQAIASVASAWAMDEPSAAARWVGTLPTGPGREYAIENVAFQWMQTDPGGFSTWVQGLPEAEDRDSAINAAVGTLVAPDPDLAINLAGLIKNDVIRRRQIKRAAEHWLKVDTVAARTWILDSTLSDEVKQQLLARQR